MMNTLELPDNLQKLIDMGISGTDIMHGELKSMMYAAEQQLILAQEEEDRTEEAIDSMQRTYWEGQCDALANVYQLTYALAFAIDERAKNEG